MLKSKSKSKKKVSIDEKTSIPLVIKSDIMNNFTSSSYTNGSASHINNIKNSNPVEYFETIQDEFINKKLQLSDAEEKAIKSLLMRCFALSSVGYLEVCSFLVGLDRKYQKIENFRLFMTNHFENKFIVHKKEDLSDHRNINLDLCDNPELLLDISKITNYLEKLGIYWGVVKTEMTVTILKQQHEETLNQAGSSSLTKETTIMGDNETDMTSSFIDRMTEYLSNIAKTEEDILKESERLVKWYRVYINFSYTTPISIKKRKNEFIK